MKINGKPASAGIALAKVFKIEEILLDLTKKDNVNAELELKLLDDAIVKSIIEIEEIIISAKEKMGAEHAQIFEAHKQIIQDPAMVDEFKEQIKSEKVNAAYSLSQIAKKYIAMFTNMDDEYMKERASDIKDTTNRILHHITDTPLIELSAIKEDSIIVSEDLTPSQTAQLNSFVKGFVTAIGGKTSHSAIMARSLELPAIVGLDSILEDTKNGDIILIDGTTGVVIINPDDSEIKELKAKANFEVKEKEELKKLIGQETITTDGHKVEIAANIGSVQDVDQVLKNDAEAVGLYRSEFLYMNSKDWPSEEAQFQSYKEVLEKMGDKGVVIRTLDIGGDKKLPYFKFPEEMNPFLGYRAIRLCLDKQDIFRTQLRALLKASVYGNLKIMFPLIAAFEEWTQAKTILEEEAFKLKSENVKLGKYEVGMMMEVPTAAILADIFATEADFFSIGTNDLLQYTFACDRMNNNVSYLYQPLSPATLRFVKNIIDAAHAKGKWVGMCGEMAGDPQAIPFLLGLGLDEFSMSATSVLKARSVINSLSLAECKLLAKKALNCATEAQVKELIK